MKKVLLILLSLAILCVPLAACGGDGDSSSSGSEGSGSSSGSGTSGGEPGALGDVTLKVWASQEAQDFTRELADAFIAQYTDANVTIELGVVGEPDAYARFSEDPEAAADVFFFPNDQLRDFVNAGGLYEITRNKEDIVSRNGEGGIGAATFNGKLYGYPVSADNGYFLYYDKSVLSEEDVKSLDRMLEVADAEGKKIFMDVSNGWYIASFFLGAGGKLWMNDDGTQGCDFNNATGLAAGEAIKAFTAHNAFMTGEVNDVLPAGIGGTIAAGVGGAWLAGDIEAALGENYGATKLPEFTVDGKLMQMSSFAGYKLIGINATITDTNKLVVAMDFADFLSNEENQIARFERMGWGPSNINAAANPAVLANPALAALALQSAYATSQNDVGGSYWAPAEAFGTEMESKSTTDVQTLLDNMVAQIQS